MKFFSEGTRLWIWVLALVACFELMHCQTGPSTGTVIASVAVKGDSVIAQTDDDFICATLDWWPPDKCDYGTCSWGNASLLNLDLENPLLANAVKAFSPLKIRLGGSLQDKVLYDVGNLQQPCHPFVKNSSAMFGFGEGCLPMSRWDALNSFFTKSKAVVAFGLNVLNGRQTSNSGLGGAWDSSNARNFIQYTVDHGYQIRAWELGNELSGSGVGTRISAQQYAADIIKLRGLVEEIYGNSQVKPLIVAPDGFYDAKWFTELLQQTGSNVLNVITHHIYNLGSGMDPHLVDKILSASYLSQEAATFRGLQSILQRDGPWSSAWVGEAGGAYNSGHDLVTNAFVSSFWYLDQLAMSATFNTKSYCRQTLIGGNYGLLDTMTYAPNPDYYSALLWHRLMGRGVLSTSQNGTQDLRGYAHCSKNDRGITLLLINLSRGTRVDVHISTDSRISIQTSRVSAAHQMLNPATSNGGKALQRSRLEYHLTAKDGDLHSQTMLLNGKVLAVTPEGQIPPLDPVAVSAENPVALAPLSIAFVSIPDVQLSACGG